MAYSKHNKSHAIDYPVTQATTSTVSVGPSSVASSSDLSPSPVVFSGVTHPPEVRVKYNHGLCTCMHTVLSPQYNFAATLNHIHTTDSVPFSHRRPHLQCQCVPHLWHQVATCPRAQASLSGQLTSVTGYPKGGRGTWQQQTEPGLVVPFSHRRET